MRRSYVVLPVTLCVSVQVDATDEASAVVAARASVLAMDHEELFYEMFDGGIEPSDVGAPRYVAPTIEGPDARKVTR